MSALGPGNLGNHPGGYKTAPAFEFFTLICIFPILDTSNEHISLLFHSHPEGGGTAPIPRPARFLSVPGSPPGGCACVRRDGRLILPTPPRFELPRYLHNFSYRNEIRKLQYLVRKILWFKCDLWPTMQQHLLYGHLGASRVVIYCNQDPAHVEGLSKALECCIALYHTSRPHGSPPRASQACL